jgi:hypothetical protein
VNGLLTATLAAWAVFPGTFTDTTGERLGGVSSLRWDAAARELVVLSDRGRGDGTVPHQPRFHRFGMKVAGNRLELALRRTVPFRDAAGNAFSGLIVTTSPRLDSEGLALAPDGSLWVSDEYGPGVYNFGQDGVARRRLDPTAAFIPSEGTGRVTNRGFENLCLAPDGRRLLTLLQSPLAQEGGKKGKTTRGLLWDLSAAAAPRAVSAPMPQAPEGLSGKDVMYNECEWVDADTLILLERDNRGLGADAGDDGPPRLKRLRLAELRADGALVPGEALDLLGVLARAGVDVSQVPAKFESVAWGPTLAGRPTLLVAVDNDFEPSLPTWFFLLKL